MTKKATEKKSSAPPKETNRELRIFVIERFMNPKKINWPRDMKVAEGLVATYNSESFWSSVTLDMEIYSMSFFKSPGVARMIARKYEEFKKTDLTPAKKKVISGNTKFGEDLPRDNKPKTLRDFLTADD